jgi:hypothetical protein
MCHFTPATKIVGVEAESMEFQFPEAMYRAIALTGNFK